MKEKVAENEVRNVMGGGQISSSLKSKCKDFDFTVKEMGS